MFPLSGDNDPVENVSATESRWAWRLLLTASALSVGFIYYFTHQIDPEAIRRAKIVELAKYEITVRWSEKYAVPLLVKPFESVSNNFAVTVSSPDNKGHVEAPVAITMTRSTWDVLWRNRCWPEGSQADATIGLPVSLSISTSIDPARPSSLFDKTVCISRQGIAVKFGTVKPAPPSGPK